MKAPCKDCESRTAECHGKCEKYQAYSESRKTEYKERIEQGKLFEIKIDSIFRRMKREK